MADQKYYAWSELRLGGESELVMSATGVGRRIIQSRDVVRPGEEVTKADLKKRGLTDDEWDTWIEGGSIRTYPMPEMPANSNQSPSEFVLEGLRQGNEDIDPNVVMQLALQANAIHAVGASVSGGEEVKEVKEVK
jgi:hypothetical protein